MIPGVDVYSGYGPIDWPAVFQAGYRFALLKCAEGNEPRRDDRLFRAHVEQAKAAGLFVGAYFFPYPLEPDDKHPGRSPVEQAQRFFSVARGLGRGYGELPPIVDAEWPEVGDWGKWGVTPASLSAWLKAHCEEVTRLWGRKPILYTYPFWWRVISASADVSWAADYPLWIANYTHLGAGPPPETFRPIIPAPWDDYLFWQHSAKGSLVRVPGIAACPVDRNVFGGDLDALRRLANTDPDADTQPDILDWDVVRARFFRDDEGPPDAA